MVVWLVHHDVLVEAAVGGGQWLAGLDPRHTDYRLQTAAIDQEPPWAGLRGAALSRFQRPSVDSSGLQHRLQAGARGPQRHNPRCGRGAHCHFHVIHPSHLSLSSVSFGPTLSYQTARSPAPTGPPEGGPLFSFSQPTQRSFPAFISPPFFFLLAS